MCPNQVGTDLIHGLRHEQLFNAASWHQHKIPYLLTNRKCYAAATISIGAKALRDYPAHCITAAEFGPVSQEDIDKLNLSDHHRLEKRPESKLYFNVRAIWVENTERMHLMFGAIWGMEWAAVMNKCVQGLVARNTEFPHIWDLARIQDVFEEVRARFRNELLHFDNIIIGLCQGDRSPFLERIRFLCALSKSDESPLFVPPNTFDLDDPRGYFATTIVTRLARAYENFTWKGALGTKPERPKRVRREPDETCPRCGHAAHPGKCRSQSQSSKGSKGSSKGNASRETSRTPSAPTSISEHESDSDTGERVGASSAQLKLLKHERVRLKKHETKHQGKVVCLAFQTHRGCNEDKCTRAHVTKDYKSWDEAAQLFILLKGGQKKSNKLSKEESSAAMGALRKHIREERAKKMSPAKGRAASPKATANWPRCKP